MNEKLVYLSQSVSILEVEEALARLRRQGLQPVREVAVERRDDVVAVILGVKPFGLAEAEVFPNLKTVARFGAGFDNVDVDALWHGRRISVTYTPDVSTVEVAQFAFAMIILALRGATRDAVGLVSGVSRWRTIERGLGLADATVGIVGCGHIGVEAARLVAPLAAKTLLWNRDGRAVPLPGVDPARYEVVRHLMEIPTRCDVVSIHLALTPATHGLIGAEFFRRARDAAHSLALVNTARGSIVDEAALLDALNAGVVSNAAVDVWSSEGPDPGAAVMALRGHPGVLPTTHIGAFTRGVQRRCAMQVAANIVAQVSGEDIDGPAFVAQPTQNVG
jgi:phosphoglycerate dehydrogenase-like enzyme